jgi:hypothetical protein
MRWISPQQDGKVMAVLCVLRELRGSRFELESDQTLYRKVPQRKSSKVAKEN